MFVAIRKKKLVRPLTAILVWLAITLGGLVSHQFQQLTLDVAQLPLEWPVIVLVILLVAVVSQTLYLIDIFQDSPAEFGRLSKANKEDVKPVPHFKRLLSSLHARLLSYWGKWSALRLFATLAAGFLAGVVFLVVVFAIWFSIIVQALVAVGTFSVGLAAFYVTYSARKERRIRDMTAKVYMPLRKEVLTWLDVEYQRYTVWSDLQL